MESWGIQVYSLKASFAMHVVLRESSFRIIAARISRVVRNITYDALLSRLPKEKNPLLITPKLLPYIMRKKRGHMYIESLFRFYGQARDFYSDDSSSDGRRELRLRPVSPRRVASPVQADERGERARLRGRPTNRRSGPSLRQAGRRYASPDRNVS